MLSNPLNMILRTVKKFVLEFSRCNSNLSTIYALSSGHGKCGVAVIRVSGQHAGDVMKSLTGMLKLPEPRYAHLKKIRHPHSGETLDKGLVLWFPGPGSFTGEDCCEFQIHGGLAVVEGLLNTLGTIKNVRLAQPGEFTRRAFFNGKLDLTQVEGLSDLLAAETEIQRKQAFLQSEGFVSKVCKKWREHLIKCLAHLEAHIDFDETEIMDQSVIDDVSKRIENVKEEIQQYLEDGKRGERLRNGVKTVVLGAPNAGKSSLLNILVRRPAAIVTPVEGTTRDVLKVTLDIEGYPIVLADTAGLRRKTGDVVESEGIQRALREYKEADLVILVLDSIKFCDWQSVNPEKTFLDYIKMHLNQLTLHDLLNDEPSIDLFKKNCVVIVNKIDLLDNPQVLKHQNVNILLMSCKTQSGLSDVIRCIANELKILCGNPSEEHPSMSHERHHQSLRNCLNYLNKFAIQFKNKDDISLSVENIRRALRQIGKLTGNVTTEQLLDVIFKDFCIGK